MSKVIHFTHKEGTLITPCPYREGSIMVGSIKCKECVFHEKQDSGSRMIICSWDNYTEH